MIEGRTIICFASGYDAPPTSKHHIMHLLAERNDILWVNYHASRMPTAAASDVAYVFRKLAQVSRGMRCVRPNLHVLTPLVLPLPGSNLVRNFNRQILVLQIKRALARLPHRPRQVWSFAPDIAYLLGEFGEEKVVYYCVDDFASFSGYDKQQVLRDEAALCGRSDLVITTAAELESAKTGLCRRSLLVRHGVDYGHFSRAVVEDLPEPQELRDIAHPRLGFFGLLRDWVDLDLLAAVARQRPQWHFVLIGDSTVSLQDYVQLKNMHFIGRKGYSELPAYCRHLDVGLIPFRLNELTMAVNPIKLHEYLAAGLPVVSTALPEVVSISESAEFAGSVSIADGAVEFERAIAAALDGAGGLGAASARSAAALFARQKRSAAMAGETWQAKLEMISRSLCLPQEKSFTV